MLEDLKERVCLANVQLAEEGLAAGTWGNVSGVDRDSGHVVIKPSGVPYDGMKPKQMVVVSLDSGHVVEGDLRPSSDTPTHLELYRSFASVGGVVHSHSLYATAWSQAQREIPVMGTTHADTFHGAVPCTRLLKPEELETDYEANTGKVVVERFANLDPLHIPAVLVACHGPFVWGRSPEEAVENAAVLEQVATLASVTVSIKPYPDMFPTELLDKHFLRKHGPQAYYGQEEK
jgi:L-ribulose-5-phosphate 4-epimerase